MTARKLRVADTQDESERQDVESQWESAKRVKKQPVTWLLPGRLLNGSVSILEGAKGVSKSTFACALAAALTRGVPFLGRKKSKPQSVLWLPGEEDVATMVRPRLESAGANLERVHFPALNDRGERTRLTLPGHVHQIRDAILHFGCKLLIVDPLSSHVPPDINLCVDQCIHQVLDPVADMAHSLDCVVLMTRNLTKNTSAQRINQGLGGAAVGGVARSVLVIDWPDRRTSRRVLRVVACNLAKATPALEYELADQGGWPVLSAIRELPPDEDDADADLEESGERDTRADAVLLLRRVIGTERVPYVIIAREAEDAGIGLRTLRKAKADLGITSHRVGSSVPPHWEWGPPKGGW